MIDPDRPGDKAADTPHPADENPSAHQGPQRVVDDHMFAVDQAGFPAAAFRLQLFTAPGRRPVAVVTQTTSEGPSLANNAEQYVAAVWRRHLPDDPKPPIWIQHQILPEGESYFQLVEFEQTDPASYAVSGPGWATFTDDDVTRLVGTPVDPSRGDGYQPLPPEPEPQPRHATKWVIRLPQPHPFREPDCMPAGTPWWRRLHRQIVPRHGGQNCCSYHRGDWHRVCRFAIELVEEAQRDGVPDDEVADTVIDRAKTAGISDWEQEALVSLVIPGSAIDLGRRGRKHVNGQHRAQALIDAGVRRTVVLVWRDPS